MYDDDLEDVPCTTLAVSMLRFVDGVLEILKGGDLSFSVVLSELWWDKDIRRERGVQDGVKEMWEAFGCAFGHESYFWELGAKDEGCWFFYREQFREELRTRYFCVSFHVLYDKILKVLRRLAREAAFVPLMTAFAGIVNKQ